MNRWALASIALLLNFGGVAMLLQPLPHGLLAGQPVSQASTVEVVLNSALDTSQTVEPALPVAASSEASIDARHGERTGLVAGIDGYLPVSQLTERPQLIRDIDPEWHLPGIAFPVVTGTLLINEYGDIDRVELDTRGLSPMLEMDIRSRFTTARFAPGKLHGSSVKTALRFEVRLD